ncbi:flavin reductase [Streptomyces kaniharaensis]|uniref:Flavin reductase n=1 Tax=Streptomyces kaniharaensis TaxID=212423 RepID=A0A6N7KVS4_9ACTN|nr:flavin reductase family protein [Streptomyces kaniharaensis]MQS15561.1 flavin reductase [Streptomyces kaniharaensis]
MAGIVTAGQHGQHGPQAGARSGRADESSFRRAMGTFGTGVAVVTTTGPGGPYATTVNSLTSVSLEPPLLLVCLKKGARTAAAVSAAGAFTVSVLSAGQAGTAARLAASGRPSGERALEGIPHRPGWHGIPVLSGSLSHFGCRVERELPGGDHTIFLGRVHELGTAPDDEPLLYYRGQFARLG